MLTLSLLRPGTYLLGGDADDLADGVGLVEDGEHVVGEVGAWDGPAAAQVVPDGGAVGGGEWLAAELGRAEQGPVQAGLEQGVFHSGEVGIDLAKRGFGDRFADVAHEEPITGVVPGRGRAAG